MCDHLKKPFKLPVAATKVYKEECMICFDSQDSQHGLDVCLDCFAGFCPSSSLGHSLIHSNKFGHFAAVNIKRTLVEKEEGRPQKITKLAIQEGSADDQYQFQTSIKCLSCPNVEIKDPETLTQLGLDKVIAGILNSVSAKKKSDLKSWEDEELQTCFHSTELQQGAAKKVLGRDMAHCNSCDLKENLWLCLTCGNLGCGRPQYGGLGGNGHGMAHFDTSKHPLAVKMGSITPEGSADIFCYEHGNEVLDPQLGVHLAHFGINIEAQEKTVKSIAEMQLEQNLKFDFSMTTEDGKEMTPVSGPGYTGIINLGNSCYMASVLQTVFSIPAFQNKYYQSLHPHTCYESPADCYYCQMCKLADGLLSGRYSNPAMSHSGISPSMFKNLIGKGHPEFSTMRQQDAQEFLGFLLGIVEQKEKSTGTDPSASCRFMGESRIQCMECEHVQYKLQDTSSLFLRIPANPTGEVVDGKELYHGVDLNDCIASYFESDLREFNCPVDNQKTTASFTQRFHTYPDFLICIAGRFVLGKGWVMEKLNLEISAPLSLALDNFRATGPVASEKLFPEDSVASAEPQFDADALNQLIGMGFPEIRCKRALLKTGNNGPDVAMNWLFEHMEDVDIDDPLPSSNGAKPSGGPSDAELAPLVDMGFTKKQAAIAMKENGNNVERAVDWLFSHPDVASLENSPDPSAPTATSGSNAQPIDSKPAQYELFALISHKGTSAQCGHYVSFIKKDCGWVLFNDNKVVQVPDMSENIKQAYVYVYRRI